ncbi:hypothetical protein ACTXT7_010803 [Hymenolepis weldensis]
MYALWLLPTITYTVACVTLCYDELKQHKNAKIWAPKAVNLPALDSAMEGAYCSFILELQQAITT